MIQLDWTRRGSMLLGSGFLLGGASSSARAATSVNLEDPRERARIRAKIMGSTEDEAVHTFMRIHTYGYTHEGNLIPFYTMNNLNVRRWSPQPDGSFKVKVYECGTLSKFDTEEPLEYWDNPITGERVKAHHFRGGPLNLTVANDGTISTGAESRLKPQPLNFHVWGDSVYMLQASAFSYPNPFQPDEWPKESSGPTSYWDSHYIFIAKIDDVADPSTARAPAYVQLQNQVTWGHWMRMGQRPGRTWGRGFGAKLDSIDQIPGFARADIERRHPQIFDIDSWTELTNEVGEYKRTQSPP